MAKARKKPTPAPAPEPARPLRLEWRTPAELAENPANWRTHPQAQMDALRDAMAEVGWAGACLYNERTGRLIDGHARRRLALEQGAEAVPVLVGDWDEAAEKKILATLDPLGALATADAGALDALLREAQTGSIPLQEMLAGLAEGEGLYRDAAPAAETPFAEFGEQAGGDDFVPFKLGDYAGKVGKAVYDSFVSAYKARQQESGEPVLDDVLRGWLNV